MVGTRLISTLLLASFAAKAQEIPSIRGHLTCDGNQLETKQKARLDDRLTIFQRDTGIDFAVLVMQPGQGPATSLFAKRVFEAWKIGLEHKGGVLLVVSGDLKSAEWAQSSAEEPLKAVSLSNLDRLMENDLSENFGGRLSRCIEKAHRILAADRRLFLVKDRLQNDPVRGRGYLWVSGGILFSALILQSLRLKK